MESERLVYQVDMTVQDETYRICVYCRKDGHHVATTHISTKDVIINDGQTLEEALEKHTKLLPLAICSRKTFKYL